ncbi:MAG: methyltransferase domain-containing protein [Myxococcota bacterium]
MSQPYRYTNAKPSHTHAYLMPTVERHLERVGARTVFDLGCGNGSKAHHLSRHYEVTGVDASSDGIREANRAYPELKLEIGSAYDDLADRYGTFDAVVSLEVVEHLYEPRRWASTLFSLVKPGGIAVVSTPYHGYLKNLVLAATGKMDNHFTALWDGGHIKFWSIATLSALLQEAGFRDLDVSRVGRIPPLAKSMIVATQKPLR